MKVAFDTGSHSLSCTFIRSAGEAINKARLVKEEETKMILGAAVLMDAWREKGRRILWKKIGGDRRE